MKAVTAEFVARCHGPHRVVAQVDVYEADGVTPIAEAVGCVNGTVTLDRKAAVYGRFSGTFVGLDQTLVARMVKDRCVLRVTRGVELTAAIPSLPVYLADENGTIITTEDGSGITVGDTDPVVGTTETFGLGRFTITEVTQDLRTLEVDIVAMDASYLVAERRLPVEYEATAGTPVGDHIYALLSEALMMDAPTNFPTTPDQATTVVIGIDQDPWRACQDMALAVAHELRVDADGMFVMVPVPSTATATATWTIDGDIQSGSVGWSWVAEAESVTVIGSNPESATIYEGTDVEDDAGAVGAGSLRKLVIRDENIGSDAQAAEAAAAARRQQRGCTRTVELSGWWPWAEPTDVVRIVTENTVALNELRVLDRVTVPLLGPIQVSTARDPLVEALKPAPALAKVAVDWIEGVVTSTSPLKVDGRRAATVDSYTPTLDDKVQVHRSGGRRLIIGKVA